MDFCDSKWNRFIDDCAFYFDSIVFTADLIYLASLKLSHMSMKYHCASIPVINKIIGFN